MKNICFVNSYACIGGAEKSLQSLIIGFKDLGYNIRVVVGESGPLVEWLVEKNIPFNIIRQPSLQQGIAKYIFPLYLLSFTLRMMFLIKSNRIDIIHTNTFRSRVYCSFANLFSPCKLIGHVRDIEISSINNFLINRYDHTIAISNAVKNAMLENTRNKNCDTSKVKVIYNGVEENNLLKTENNGIIRIGMFARYDEWKCHHILVQSIGSLKPYLETLHNKVEFYFFGDALRPSEQEYKAHIVSMINELDLKNYVHIMGYKEKPLNEMQKMDLIVCPSDNEPFGRVIIEAMSLEKIVIASNNGGVSEILNDGFSELLFKPRDVDSLSNKIRYYIENKDALENRYAIKLHKHYLENFSITQLLDKVSSLY